MTHLQFPHPFDSVPFKKTIFPSTVGFDRIFSSLEDMEKMFGNYKPSTYPPYNILVNDNQYEIQIAVSGFKRENLDITLENDLLVVIGDIKEKEDNNMTYLHRGLASRKFEHKFKLSENVVVKSAKIEDGILYVNLEHIIPESSKMKQIPIL